MNLLLIRCVCQEFYEYFTINYFQSNIVGVIWLRNVTEGSHLQLKKLIQII
jgi:hypothetical protein